MLWCTVTFTRWMWQVLTLDAPRMCMSHFIVLASFCSTEADTVTCVMTTMPSNPWFLLMQAAQFEKKTTKKQSGATHFSVLLWTLSFVIFSFFDLLHLSWRDCSYLNEMVDKTATCSTCGTFLNALQVSWQKQTVSGHVYCIIWRSLSVKPNGTEEYRNNEHMPMGVFFNAHLVLLSVSLFSS